MVAGLFKVLYITWSFRYRWHPFIAECVEDFGIFIITSAAVFSKSDVKFLATVFSRCLFVYVCLFTFVCLFVYLFLSHHVILGKCLTTVKRHLARCTFEHNQFTFYTYTDNVK